MLQKFGYIDAQIIVFATPSAVKHINHGFNSVACATRIDLLNQVFTVVFTVQDLTWTLEACLQLVTAC